MRRLRLPILFASAALFVGAAPAVAHKARCDSGDCSGKHRDEGDDLSLEKEHDGSPLGTISFNDDNLDERGLGKKKHLDSDHEKHKGKHRDDQVMARGDDDDNGGHQHANSNDDDDGDKGDHNGGTHHENNDRIPVPEPGIGLLLAAPLLAVGLRNRKRR